MNAVGFYLPRSGRQRRVPNGDAMIRALMQAGGEFDVVAYGTEALGVMRIEKGHAAGNELNGTTSALNLGMGRMVSKTKDSLWII